MKRPHINLKKKLAAAILTLVQYDEDEADYVRVISHEAAKKMTVDQILSSVEWHHAPIPKAEDGPDEPWNLVPIPKAKHREITAKFDIPRIAKNKRITKDQEEHRRRMLAKEPGKSARPKSRWASRPFPKRTAHASA